MVVIDSTIATGQACLARQEVPDVVFANAGIDTSVRAGLDAMAHTFATHNLGLAATFHPFVTPMVKRGSGKLVGVASVADIRGLQGTAPIAPAKLVSSAIANSLRGK